MKITRLPFSVEGQSSIEKVSSIGNSRTVGSVDHYVGGFLDEAREEEERRSKDLVAVAGLAILSAIAQMTDAVIESNAATLDQASAVVVRELDKIESYQRELREARKGNWIVEQFLVNVRRGKISEIAQLGLDQKR